HKGLATAVAMLSKPSGEERLVCSIHKRTATPANKKQPETRCKMDTIAVIGNLIVDISRLTGLFLFTVDSPIAHVVMDLSLVIRISLIFCQIQFTLLQVAPHYRD